MEKIKYSNRSNGNCKDQNCRTGGGSHSTDIRYDNEPTGDTSQQDLMDVGVSSREPFERQPEDYADMVFSI